MLFHHFENDSSSSKNLDKDPYLKNFLYLHHNPFFFFFFLQFSFFSLLSFLLAFLLFLLLFPIYFFNSSFLLQLLSFLHHFQFLCNCFFKAFHSFGTLLLPLLTVNLIPHLLHFLLNASGIFFAFLAGFLFFFKFFFFSYRNCPFWKIFFTLLLFTEQKLNTLSASLIIIITNKKKIIKLIFFFIFKIILN